MFSVLQKDGWYALRRLRRKPGLSVVAITTILLGVSVSTAIFSIVNAILIQPLPYRDPDSLVMLWNLNPEAGYTYDLTKNRGRSMSAREFKAWRDESGIFEEMVGFASRVKAIFDPENPDITHGYFLTEGGFEMLGIQPLIGRTPTPQEQLADPASVIVIRQNFWRRYFNSDPNVVSRTVELEGDRYSVIGVMPEDFVFFNRQAEFLSSLPMERRYASDNYSRTLRVMARLKKGMSIGEAQRRAAEFSTEMERRYPETNKGWSVKVVTVSDDTAGPLRPALQTLTAAVGLVMLIMCVNVACLLLIDVSSRAREFAVHSASGATPWQLVRRLLVESLTLAGVGGALGLGLGYGLIAYFRTMTPDRFGPGKYFPQLERIQLDSSVAGFAVAAALLAGVIVGLLPAWRASRSNLVEELKEGGRGSTGAGRHGLRSSLVVAEVALGLVLMASASLLVRSFAQLHAQGSGIQSDGVLTMVVNQHRSFYYYDAIKQGMDHDSAWNVHQHQLILLNRKLLDAVARIPGVEKVGLVTDLPMAGWFRPIPFGIEGGSYETDLDYPEAIYKIVSPDYFDSVKLPLRLGRLFEPTDYRGRPWVFVINDVTAQEYFPDENPVGRRIQVGGPQGADQLGTVIGVVGSVREAGMDQPPVGAMYSSANQFPPGDFFLTIRASVDPLSLTPTIRRAIRDCCPNTPIYRIREMEAVINDSAWRLRYSAVLLSGLAGLALLLAAVGVYGILSDSIRNRTAEFGVRAALGAGRGDILRMVLRQGLMLVGFGVVIGLAASVVMMRYLESLLFGVAPFDVLAYSFSAAVLLAAGLLATTFPAWRAVAVQPVHALRQE